MGRFVEVSLLSNPGSVYLDRWDEISDWTEAVRIDPNVVWSVLIAGRTGRVLAAYDRETGFRREGGEGD